MYALVQTCSKAVLAAVGWWTVWVFPPSPLPLMPFSTALWLPAPAYAVQSELLFVAVTCVDVVWHWRSEWTNMAHHVCALVATFGCMWLGGFGHILLCATLILETVGPVYQLLKLRTHSVWLRAHAQEARLCALAINLCVRGAYFLWLGLSVTWWTWQRLTTGQTIDAPLAIVCLLGWVNAWFGLVLDALWSGHLVRSLARHSSLPAASSATAALTQAARRGPNWVSGASAALCFGAVAWHRRSVLPTILVVNSLHYHWLAPHSRIAYAIDVGYNAGMMGLHLLTQPSIPLFVCVAVSVGGWYTGVHWVQRWTPQYAEVWHALTCHVPAALGMVGCVQLVV